MHHIFIYKENHETNIIKTNVAEPDLNLWPEPEKSLR
jgi:hypothetical protein